MDHSKQFEKHAEWPDTWVSTESVHPPFQEMIDDRIAAVVRSHILKQPDYIAVLNSI